MMSDADEINTDQAFTKTVIGANQSDVSELSSLQGEFALASDPLIGTIIAERYQIEKLMGQGGMASVYAARHITLDKRFASDFGLWLI